MVQNLKKLQAQNTTKPLLILLLLGDLAFLIIHVFHKITQKIEQFFPNTGNGHIYSSLHQYLDINLLYKLAPHFANPMFNIEMDNGYAETYQHFKFLSITFIFLYLCIKHKTWSFLPWAFLFAYFFLDDSMQLHERLGTVIATEISITPPFGLRRQDLGELTVVITTGLIILPSLLIAYYFGRPPLRNIYRNLTMILALLIVFGVGVDMVHVVFMNSPIFSPVFGLMEDGGEMLVVSIFGWYSFSLVKQFLNLKDVGRISSTSGKQAPALVRTN